MQEDNQGQNTAGAEPKVDGTAYRVLVYELKRVARCKITAADAMVARRVGLEARKKLNFTRPGFDFLSLSWEWNPMDDVSDQVYEKLDASILDSKSETTPAKEILDAAKDLDAEVESRGLEPDDPHGYRGYLYPIRVLEQHLKDMELAMESLADFAYVEDLKAGIIALRAARSKAWEDLSAKMAQEKGEEDGRREGSDSKASSGEDTE
jgi:hypothetical protein